MRRKLQSQIKYDVCPICGARAQPRMVGDWKDLVVVFCSSGHTAGDLDPALDGADSKYQAAAKRWNRAVFRYKALMIQKSKEEDK